MRCNSKGWTRIATFGHVESDRPARVLFQHWKYRSRARLAELKTHRQSHPPGVAFKTWLTLEGEQQTKFQQFGGPPLNHHKQKWETCFPTTTMNRKICLPTCGDSSLWRGITMKTSAQRGAWQTFSHFSPLSGAERDAPSTQIPRNFLGHSRIFPAETT